MPSSSSTRRAGPRSKPGLDPCYLRITCDAATGPKPYGQHHKPGELCSRSINAKLDPFLKMKYKSYWGNPTPQNACGTHSWGRIENRSVLPHRHGPRSGMANVGSPFENARLPAGTTIVKPKPILEPTKTPPSHRLQVPQTSTRQPDNQTATHPATQNPKQSKVTLRIRTKCKHRLDSHTARQLNTQPPKIQSKAK